MKGGEKVSQPAKAADLCTDVYKADSPHCILGINDELAATALEQ
jgi:hypothetical protein